MIPNWLFREELPKVPIQLPYCMKNERASQKFIEKMYYFSKKTVRLIITWKTWKIKSLFPLKDIVTHKLHAIYEGRYSCSVNR